MNHLTSNQASFADSPMKLTISCACYKGRMDWYSTFIKAFKKRLRVIDARLLRARLGKDEMESLNVSVPSLVAADYSSKIFLHASRTRI